MRTLVLSQVWEQFGLAKYGTRVHSSCPTAHQCRNLIRASINSQCLDKIRELGALFGDR